MNQQSEFGAAIDFPIGSSTPISPLPPQPFTTGVNSALNKIALLVKDKPANVDLATLTGQKIYCENDTGANSREPQLKQSSKITENVQSTFLLHTPTNVSPNIRISGPPTQEQADLATHLNTLSFQSFRYSNGVCAFPKGGDIKISAETNGLFNDKLNLDLHNADYLQPNIVTLSVKSQNANWNHAYLFPRQKRIFLEQLVIEGSPLSVILKQKDNSLTTIPNIAKELGYDVSLFPSAFFPGGLLSLNNQGVTIESVEKYLLTQSRTINIDERTTRILERIRQTLPDTAQMTLHMYGRDQRKKGHFSFASNGRTGVTSIPLNSTREQLKQRFAQFNDDYIVLRNNDDEYCKTTRDNVAGVISRYKFEKFPLKTTQELIEPYAVVPYDNTEEPSIIMSREGVGCVLYHGARCYSIHINPDEIWQKVSMHSIAKSLVDYTQYERRIRVLAAELDDPAQLQRFSFQNNGEAIGISSKVIINKEIMHIPMLDFCTPSYEQARESIRKIDEKGFIVGSGESFHFYGNRLLSKAELVPFYTKVHHELLGTVDSTHVAFALKRKFACLRLTPSINRKITQPVYIDEV